MFDRVLFFPYNSNYSKGRNTMYKEELKKLRYALYAILFADAMLVATSRVDLGSRTLNEPISEETLLDSECNEETSLVEEAKITSESDFILQEGTHKIEEKNYCTDDYCFRYGIK